MEKLKVFIVDDHSIFKKGLTAQLKEFHFLELIGTAENGQDFLEKIELNMPELVFMDIKMPIMNGIEATQIAFKKHPELKIIALSMFGEEEYLQQMLDAGAKGFLLKNIEKDDLEKAIKTVLEGNNYFSQELLTIITSKFVTKPNPEKFENKTLDISEREKEVLQLICQGYTNIEIGNKLNISPRTVDGHRANLLDKVGAKNSIGLVTYAIKNKLVCI